MALLTERDKCAHLLRRFALGASESELEYYLRNGLNGAIDLLVDYEKTDEGFSLPITAFQNPVNGRLPMQGVLTWWTLRMLMTRRPLQEKMTLFWHNHFSTSAGKVTAPLVMLEQNELLRRNATGSLRNLLSAVSKDPAMIIWLDAQQNVKGHPNENFGREVMELFTLGIGHYTEKDIKEGARAFTGWSVKRIKQPDGKSYTAEFMERPRMHDEGQKSFLGNVGYFTGDDILNILCDQPRTAEYIVWKMWSWFGYPNPEPHLVERLAGEFRESGLDIKTLLRTIMTSREFYSARAERAIVKCPVDFCVTTLRQLGMGELIGDAVRSAGAGDVPRARLAPVTAAAQAMKSMGMWLLYPPDVSGWKFGQAWISSATMVERMSWADQLFGQSKSAKVRFSVPGDQVFANNMTAHGVVEELISAFDVSIKPAKVAYLLKAAQSKSGGAVTPENVNETAAAVCHLLFATPEFQMA